MSRRFSKQRKIARLLLLVWAFNLFMPSMSYALTSGPAQPETQGFQPAGISDMVDLQTGDFKYNIPLLDIDGYPINLNYQSGTGIDDEASWVGLGWSLNTGSINRQVRGIADDMKDDKVQTEHYTKPMTTVGGRISGKTEVFGLGTTGLGIGTSASYGVFLNNYTGIGAEVSINPGISLSRTNTNGLSAGLGFGISSNTQSGVSFSPYASISIYSEKTSRLLNGSGLSGSLTYNSRSGLKSLSLGATYGGNVLPVNNMGLGISYNTEPVNPHVSIPYHTDSESYSIDAGGVAFGVFIGGGFTGYRTKKSVQKLMYQTNAYGLLYAQDGKNDPLALMDFIREKENMVVPELPNLAVPIQTHDLFSYTNQSSSGQFRLHRGGTGIFFDNVADDTADDISLGLDIGFGGYVHAGMTFFQQTLHNTTRKWTNNNNYLHVGDFQDMSPEFPNQQHAYFKVVGEKVEQDNILAGKLKDTQTVGVDVEANIDGNHNSRANSKFRTGSATTEPAIAEQIITKKPQPTATVVSYLTASHAEYGGLDKKINIYNAIDITDASSTPIANPKPVYSLTRVDNTTPVTIGNTPQSEAYPASVGTEKEVNQYPARKGHHISEISVTDGAGKRMVYGIPVYNIQQNEYSFAMGKYQESSPAMGNYTTLMQGGDKTNISQTPISTVGTGKPGGGNGLDNYYHKESIPPYATSYLLTSILSADYVDKTGDGISNDDLGTAIKFNYTRLNGLYNWRSPFTGVNINKGQLADPNDDKGSVIYGKKEIWYTSSIETKTKIAYFITEDRLDGLGSVDDWKLGGQKTSFKQKRLRQIRLYSKADMSRPIKVVNLAYAYELCPFTPNSELKVPGNEKKAKLTLKSVWFEYANVEKGQHHQYKFSYYQPDAAAAGEKGAYGYMVTDRWGVYKSRDENINSALSNEEFPYSNQDNERETVNENVALWHLNKIELPTGGTINVNYETDDYAFVQNKKAMSMCKILALTGDEDAVVSNLGAAKGIKLSVPLKDGETLPTTIDKSWFINKYLNGSEYMYTKLYVKMNTDNNNVGADIDYDYVPYYAKIDVVKAGGNNTVIVIFETVNEDKVTANPIALASWQKLKNEYPNFAYPGYQNKDLSVSLINIIQATVYAISNLGELTGSFYKKAKDNGYCRVNTDKSFVRLTKNDGDKVGGGARVSSVVIHDNWNELNGTNDAATKASYGQQYTYKLENGQSSGVASYEPAIGNDENPFKQAIPYVQKVKGGDDNSFYLEEPFGESVFPAPGITYSRVEVRDLIKNGSAMNTDPNTRTGYTVNEFYTTRDFPVKVNVLPIVSDHYTPKASFSLIETNSEDYLLMSQGYSIELNDMNGKLKASRVFKETVSGLNKQAIQTSATEYYYKSDRMGTNEYTLNNHVKVIDNDGKVRDDVTIGQDVELFTDFREQESSNNGVTVNTGFDVVPAGPFPWTIPHVPIKTNRDYSMFRSACAFKVVQSYGILDKVVKTQDGSSITTQNIAFDGLTGEALVTRTQNKLKKDIYTVNIPAYWGYKGMGGSYQNLGMIIGGLKTKADGQIENFTGQIVAGDVIVDLTDMPSGTLYWVIEQPYETQVGPVKRRYLVDRYGKITKKEYTMGLCKVIRSGYRNILDGSISSFTCLNNPITSGTNSHLQFADNVDITALKVLNASASEYNENWSVEVPDIKVIEPPNSLNWASYKEAILATTYFRARLLTGYGPLQGTRHTEFGGGDLIDQPVPGAQPWKQHSLNSSISPSFMNLADEVHLFAKFTIPTAGRYYFGVDANIPISVNFGCDDALAIKDFRWNFDTRSWSIAPYDFTEGDHFIHIVVHAAEANLTEEVVGAFGIEIYRNTEAQIKNHSNIDILWSTADLHGINNHGQEGLDMAVYYTKKTDPSVPSVPPEIISKYRWTGDPETIYTPCSPPSKAINPYIYGFRGNWRLSKTKVVQQKRVYQNIADPMVNIKNAGYIDGFRSNWYSTGTVGSSWQLNTNSNWVTANTITMYDKYGQQLENQDVLDRYSAAKFDFNGELPSAVVSNAMKREIYANGFEDTKFTPGAPAYIDPQKLPYFVSASGGELKNIVNGYVSHSGNYSVRLPAKGLILSTNIFNKRTNLPPFLTLNLDREYEKTPGVGKYPNEFEPLAKKYLFSAWIKDRTPNSRTNNGIRLYQNTTEITLTCKAIVEGWKLMEGTIDLTEFEANSAYSANGIPLELKIVHTDTGFYDDGGIHVDDIRIHPEKSQMKTYAYDEKTMRLMAELDENCFATFYEYDSQGLLVRVKKETERGIMTLKESRSSYKKGL